jgi:molybdopterin-guanine dinucleotide biosynthesis protein A
MDTTPPAVAAFILAGGKRTRIGVDKAFIALDGRTLLARALGLARLLTQDVRIVGEAEKFRAFAPAVEDVFPGCGPLGGIHAALLPFLLTRAHSSGATVTVARAGGGWQPLCGVYRREFADVGEKALREGRCKVDALFDDARTLAIGEEELEAAGFSASVFRNLNTREELEAAGK